MANIFSELKNNIIINSVYCWTDSQISLAWIRSINKQFKTFVQKQVLSIRKKRLLLKLALLQDKGKPSRHNNKGKQKLRRNFMVEWTFIFERYKFILQL